LAGKSVFNPEYGPPVRTSIFQTKPAGWFLDDVLVTTKGDTTYHIEFSLKSNPQFTASKAPRDFVKTIWEQWLHIGSEVFDRSLDLMGIITAQLSTAAYTSVRSLIAKIRVADPDSFPRYIGNPNWANKNERNLFSSFACPTQLTADRYITASDTVRLLQRIIFYQHDFGTTPSQSLNDSLGICRDTLRNKSAIEAEKLWNELRSIAAEYRPHAGSIGRNELVEKLRRHFVFVDYPDHAADWVTLEGYSRRSMQLICDSIAGRIHLPQESTLAAISEVLSIERLIALTGDSGVGKSAVARSLFESRVSVGGRTLWFDAHSFECPDMHTIEANLHLRYSFENLFTNTSTSDSVLILDGLDSLYPDTAFRNVAMLLHIAYQEAPTAQWRIVLPCQSNEWPRVLECIRRAGFIDGQWKQIELKRISNKELAKVRDAIPSFTKVLLQPRMADLLGNLKILDLVARHVIEGSVIDASSWVGESSVADWFWRAIVDVGQNATIKVRFVRCLAQIQGDNLSRSVSIDDFPSEIDISPLDLLQKDQICIRTEDDLISFSHDLYGDWIRLHILLGHHTDLASFLRSRRESPIWQRAIRLLGVHLLEHSGGIEEWRTILESLDTKEDSPIYDLLLDAPIFTTNPLPLLEAIEPDLLANHGQNLRRFLSRFLVFATVADPMVLAFAKVEGMDENVARATHRIPYWPYWLDVIRLLHTHKAEVVAVAPYEIACVVELWLTFKQKGRILRSEVAELGVLLGRYALESAEVYGGPDLHVERQKFFECALLSACEWPDEVAEIALRAANRKQRLIGSSVASEESRIISEDQRIERFVHSASNIKVWPDGPQTRIDDAFQDAVLKSQVILALFDVRPDIAREIVLATLIEPPREVYWYDDMETLEELAIVEPHGWHPAFYTDGPFLSFLQMNFKEGLELIARLVDFATSRWNEYEEKNNRDEQAYAQTQGEFEDEQDQQFSPSIYKGLMVGIEEEAREFYGDMSVYGWSAGLGNPPAAVEASLMALEQYFYIQLDKGKDVTSEIEAVLARVKSVAFLGVLCDVGKRQHALFEGPLRPLLSKPEFYEWDINKMVLGREHLMIDAFLKGNWFMEIAPKFHQLEHRKEDLRNIATFLMLQCPAMREYFNRVRIYLEASRAPDSSGPISPMVDQLITLLNPSNYQLYRNQDNSVELVNVEELRLQQKHAPELRLINNNMLILTFPMQCQKVLEEEQKLANEELDVMYKKWKRICGLTKRDGEFSGDKELSENRYVSAMLAGIAVFLHYPDWCAQESSRNKEFITILRAVLENPPDIDKYDSPYSVSKETWDCFAADAVVTLWAREPANVEWRQAVAEMVFAQHYAAVALLFARCASMRTLFRTDFSQLRRLAIEWAYIRKFMEAVPNLSRDIQDTNGAALLERMPDAIADWAQERVAAFVSGSIMPMLLDWDECDNRRKFSEIASTYLQGRPLPAIDLHLVRCVYDWLPLPEKALDENERHDWIQFWHSALKEVIKPRIATREPAHRRYPNEDERWFLDSIAAVVLQLRDDEHADFFWQAIFDLYGEGHNWSELFIQALHRHALTQDQPPQSYVSLLHRMVSYALTDIKGKTRWPWYERVWDALIGVDMFSIRLWEPRHTVVIKNLSDTLDLWMAQVSSDENRLVNFASWLARPAAEPVRLHCLGWFLNHLPVRRQSRSSDFNSAADAIASLLNVTWTKNEIQLRNDEYAFRSFRKLLTWSGDQQNELGLDLLSRIGSL